MKTLPPIGSRVVYNRAVSEHLEPRTCTGTVVAHYPSDGRHWDPNEFCWYTSCDRASVKVDTIPDWWPYRNRDGKPNTDLFAPDVAELEVVK